MQVLPLTLLASLTVVAAVHAAPAEKPASTAEPASAQAVAAPAAQPVVSETVSEPITALAARMVWATPAGIYHCPADQWFGRTSDGHFMNEDDARARGYKPNTGHACNAPI